MFRPPSPRSRGALDIHSILNQQDVDVHVPKVAEMKRKNQASASAKFRAKQKEKQKEKEQEALQKISILVQQIHDAVKAVEYYRTERNHFKAIVLNQLGAEQHDARPPSPQLGWTPPSIAPSTAEGGSIRSAGSYSEDNGQSEE